MPCSRYGVEMESKSRQKCTNIHLFIFHGMYTQYHIRLPTLLIRLHRGKTEQIKPYAFGAVGGSKTNILRARRAIQSFVYYNITSYT